MTHEELFEYANWSIRRLADPHELFVYSSGTATKTSNKYPLKYVVGTIEASVTGGYGWISAYDENYEETNHNSLMVYCKVSICIEKEDGTRLEKATATGKANRAGRLNEFSQQTTETASFDTDTLTAAEREAYPYLRIIYTAGTSHASVSCDRYDAYMNGGDADPWGTCSFDYRDDINTLFDNIRLTDLKYLTGSDTTDIRYMEFDDNPIF